MKLNFILLAIVIAFIICYCFSKKRIQEGQISAAPQSSGGLLSGYEDTLIGINEDYKLFRFNNPKKEWTQLRGKSCCVTDLAYWNNTLLGVGRYDHRLYAWDKMGVRGGLWKLATNLPMEWMQCIGVWKNKLFCANQQSIFRWTGKADGKNVEPFKRGNGKKPVWVWCGAKPNVKSIKEYRNQLYIVDKKGRIEMLVGASLDQQGKLKGSWKRVGQPTEGLRSICEWNDKLMGVGTDNHLYQWSDERQNWFSKTTKFKLLSILSLTYDEYQRQFNKPSSPFSCADGFKIEPEGRKRCYRAEGDELDWWSAYNKCKDADPGRKTTLAVISSKEENDFVKGLMQYPKWIGCSDKDKEGDWKWPDGETLQKKGYSNWNQKEPNNAAENEHFCEQYESGVWNDAAANEKRPYVCSHTTTLRREAGGKGGGRKCTEHKDKKKNYLHWNSNKWPVTAKDKDDCKNLCENDPKCPQADYYETGKRCYLYADNDAPGARRPRITGSTPGETYFKCNTEAFTGSMKEGFRLMSLSNNADRAAPGQQCPVGGRITTVQECQTAAQRLGRRYSHSGNWSGTHPEGCFTHYNNHVYFNNSVTNWNRNPRYGLSNNYPPICKDAEGTPPASSSSTMVNVRLAARTAACADSERIKTPAECGRAALKLRDEKNYFKSGAGLMTSSRADENRVDIVDGNLGYRGTTAHPQQHSWGHLPQGCSVHTGNTNNYVYFNKQRPSYIHQSYQAICGNATSSSPPPASSSSSSSSSGRRFGIAGYTSFKSSEWKKMSWDDMKANESAFRAYYNANGGLPVLESFRHANCCVLLDGGIGSNLYINGQYAYGVSGSGRNCPNGQQHSKGDKFKFAPSTGATITSLTGSHRLTRGRNCSMSNNPTIYMAGAATPAPTSSSKYERRPKNTNCATNTDIKTEAECQKAIRELGLKYDPWWRGNHGNIPRGCTWTDAVMGSTSRGSLSHWNGWTSSAGKPRFDLHPICTKGTSSSSAASSGPKRGTDCGEVPFGKGWWNPTTGACYQTCPSNSQQRNEKRRCICGKGGHNQNCTAGTSCKNNECVPDRGTVKAHELAGDYDVYYGPGTSYPKKRTGNSGGSKGLQITCDGAATQPGVFVDKVHTSGVASVCKDDAATFMIKKTHGPNKWECLRKVGDKISGDHYINNGKFWGTVEYRKKANQDAKYKCQAPYQASAPSLGVCDDKTCVFDNITIGPAKERSAVFTVKKTMFVTKIVFEHKAGRISCARAGGNSNFGCGKDYVALIITDSNKREILPNVNVKGYKKTHHNSKTQAHWYRMDGVGRDSKTMTWELNAPQTFMPGDYRLWYNEDITNWTESDNIGWATYKMTMTDAAGQTTKFKDQMLKDLNSGLCLGVEPKGEEAQEGDGGRVVLSYCQRGDDKMWSYDPDSMNLTNRIPGACAVIQGASKANAAQVIMGKCNQDNGARHFYNKTNGTFYTDSGKCLDIHSGAKSVPAKNKLPGSLIQWGCHGGLNQRFRVVAPPPAPPVFKSTSDRNSVMIVGETPLTIKKNNMLRIINAGRNYRLEFTITPTGKIPNWSEIFHVTTSDRDCCGIGDRMPGCWFYHNTTRLHIRSGGADGGNLGIDPPMELPLNKETTVVIELNEGFMTVKYSGAVTYQTTIARSKDRPYGKAKFYACSNWYNAAKATVKNVRWTNKNSAPLGKNSVTCNLNVGGKLNSVKYKGKDLKIYGDVEDRKAIKTVNFVSNEENMGKLTVDAQNTEDTDGCKTSGFLMSCKADPSNPWNEFTSNKTHWSATGIAGRSFRDKSGFPCETAASNLSISPKEGFRNRIEGFVPGKKIWANTGQGSVKFEGGPRLSPEVSCPKDFHGVPFKITAWGNTHDNGTASVQTNGGSFNIFNKDVSKIKGSHSLRVRPKQPKNGKWFADPIKETKTDSQGTLYLKTHMNSQWIRIENDYRECFKEATNIFVTSGELGSGSSGEQCSGGLQYLMHPKSSLCPPQTQIKTKEECERAVLSLGIGKGEKDNYPWDKVLEAKSPAGCSWTDRAGGDGPATVRWNSWPNSAGEPLKDYHPICYSKPPSQAAIELIKTEGCHKCPAGTYSKEGSNECVVCTKNSTNPQCKEGGKDATSGLVCPAGTSSTGAVVTAEGKPMNLGEEQSSGNNSSESLKDQCKAFNSGAICDPPCNNTHGRCVGGMCVCGGGYRGPTCDEPPKFKVPTVEEWNAAFEAKKDTKEAQEEANKPETISYGYHEHTNMNKPFTDSLRLLNKDVQELLVEARKQKEKKKKQRSFLPSEFLGWSQAIPGLLGKSYKGSAQPKPIDVGIAIDDRRKIHFRQQGKGKDTKLAQIKSSPQVISSDAGKITSGSAQKDLKGANSFENPETAPYRGFNDDSYLKGPNKPIQKAG